MSREINCFGVLTSSNEAEGNMVGNVMRELLAGPARSENQGMCRTFMRENREIPRSPVRVMSGRVARGTLRRYA